MDFLPLLKRGASGVGLVGRLVSWRAYPPNPWERGERLVSLLVQGIWDTTEV